jgi:hypothetical protein
MIFMNFSPRSSRVTGPKMRVPIGSSFADCSAAPPRCRRSDQRTVLAAHALAGPHDDGVVHLALLDLAPRDRVLDGNLDDVADAGVAALRAAQDLDALNATRTTVVGRVQIMSASES